MEDVLVDAATRHARGRILRPARRACVSAHALTHAHADHQGASHAVGEELGLPLYVGEADADAAQTGDVRPTMPLYPVTRFQLGFWAGPAHPVQRRLTDGDEVGGFTVIDMPGHSPGHVAFWRERDLPLVTSDVLFGHHPATGRPRPHEPPRMFTHDPAVSNRESIRRIAALKPAVTCFGHRPPWRDPDALGAFAAALP